MEQSNLFFLLAMASVTALGCPADNDSDSKRPDAADTENADNDSATADDGATTVADPSDTDIEDTETGDGGTSSADDPGDDSNDAPENETDTGASTETGTPPAGSGCEQYYATYDACHPEYAGEGDCALLFEQFPDDEACASALDDYYGCLSELECQSLDSLDGFPCRDGFAATNAACDGYGGSCQGGSGSLNETITACDTSLFNCLDDHEYRVECATSAGGDTVECTCSIDGEASGTTTLQTDLAWCAGEDLGAALASDCGWPESVTASLI